MYDPDRNSAVNKPSARGIDIAFGTPASANTRLHINNVDTSKSAVLKIRKMEEFVYDEKHYSTIITRNDETEEEEIGPIIQVRM